MEVLMTTRKHHRSKRRHGVQSTAHGQWASSGDAVAWGEGFMRHSRPPLNSCLQCFRGIYVSQREICSDPYTCSIFTKHIVRARRQCAVGAVSLGCSPSLSSLPVSLPTLLAPKGTRRTRTLCTVTVTQAGPGSGTSPKAWELVGDGGPQNLRHTLWNL